MPRPRFTPRLKCSLFVAAKEPAHPGPASASLYPGQPFISRPAGVVDLEFTGKDHAGDQLRRDLEPYRAPDMHWITTGKSICLRIKVRPVDFHGSFTVHNDQGDIDLALDAAERLSALATLLNDKGYRV